jgi:hypothetical protein
MVVVKHKYDICELYILCSIYISIHLYIYIIHIYIKIYIYIISNYIVCQLYPDLREVSPTSPSDLGLRLAASVLWAAAGPRVSAPPHRSGEKASFI